MLYVFVALRAQDARRCTLFPIIIAVEPWAAVERRLIIVVVALVVLLSW